MPVAALGPVAAAPAPATAAPAQGGFRSVLEARLGLPSPASPPPPPPSRPPPQPLQPLGAALHGLATAQARLDAVLSAARRGQPFTAGQLLALQADAYRFTQTLDVAGKLVEQAVQGVKQAVQTPL